MAKRDYYEILGVSKNADDKEIKKAYRNLQLNIIRTKTLTTNNQKKNLKKLQKLMMCFQPLKRNKDTTSLAMPEWVEDLVEEVSMEEE